MLAQQEMTLREVILAHVAKLYVRDHSTDVLAPQEPDLSRLCGQLRAVRQDLAEWDRMSVDERAAWARQCIVEMAAAARERMEEIAYVHARFSALREQAEAWRPPERLAKLREEVLQTLQHGAAPLHYARKEVAKMEAMSVDEMVASRREALVRGVAELEAEIERKYRHAREMNEWRSMLADALPE